MTDESAVIARRLADQHGLRFIDLTASSLAPGAASLLSESVARRHHVVPIGRRLGTPVIAVADPGDLFAMDALRASVGREFVAVVASGDQVSAALAALYPSSEPAAAPDTEAVEHSTEPSDLGEGVAEDEAEDVAVDLVEDEAPESTDASEPEGTEALEASEAVAADDAEQESTDDGRSGSGADADDGRDGDEEYGHLWSGRTDADGEEGSEEPGGGSKLEESLRDILITPAEQFGDLPLAEGQGTPANGAESDLLTNGTNGNGNHAANGWAPTSTLEDDEADEQEGHDVAEADVAPVPPPPPDDFQPVAAADTEIPPLPEGYGLVSEPQAPAFQGPPLARVLVEMGRVSAEDMTAALRNHQQTGDSLARYLYNQQLASEDDLVWAMAQEVGLEYVDLAAIQVDRSALNLIPDATARHHMVLPIGFEDDVPVVAMANPTDVFAMDDLRTIMGRNFKPVVATRSQIADYLRYSADADIDVSAIAQDAAGAATPGTSFELESLQAVVEDAPIVRYVNLLILQALNERASDIHIEPTLRRLRIRFRIDGVMHDATSASSSIANAVVSRLKVLGGMDITEHRVPLEGRVSLTVSDRQIDLRLATLPSLYGETVVMRLLDKSAALRTLPELGFLPATLDRYAKAYGNPYGVILVTGPTGAGKTTTLYATLQEVLTSEKAVVTVEDPVEYQIDGITQVQINRKAGLEFSTALKSILRSDPDIVLIGEIRDSDTATMAMEAALSGHLVLSTLHTNTAAATPLRLTEMGIEPFLVTSAVGSVLTQRLARVLCPHCREPFDASESDFLAAGYREPDLEDHDISTLYRAVGCKLCSHTGYVGRMVLAEVMNMSEEIDRMIIEQASIVNIERMACEQGMRTLRQDGLKKALMGQTTLEEVLRVVV